jgi:heterodisulfide reductase subunit C
MEKEYSLANKIMASTGVSTTRCYQCGKCSAGCPMADEMDYTSSALLRMLQTEESQNDEAILQSETIWLCLNCHMCIARCPMQVDIPKIMDFLREKTLQENKQNSKSKNIIRFHKAFNDMIKANGRSYEFGLILDFKARSKKLLQDITVAPKLLSKGKLPLLPDAPKDKKQISRIYKHLHKV